MKFNLINSVALVLLFIVCKELNCSIIKDVHKIADHIHAKGHDTQVDHEAFLGADESNKYDKLTEEESKNRLKNLIQTKVDLDADNIVTEDELKQWITHISQLTKEIERDRAFKMFSNSSSGLLSYDSYFNATYGSSIENDDVTQETLDKMKMHDIRKWELVDVNKDNNLDKEEFLVFLHPEDYPKMKSLVIQEVMEVSDKNKDGYLDLEEYISDIWSPSRGGAQPDESMLKIEQDNFNRHRDLNKDGKLDNEEIGEWLMPSNYDAAVAETQHLLHYADKNKDRKLSMEEILESHEVFAGSQATDYGNSLTGHEEL